MATPLPAELSFERAKDERELNDVLWRVAVDDAYRRGLMHMIRDRSRLGVIEWYLAENPEVAEFVARNKAAGTCAAAAELLRELEERAQHATKQCDEEDDRRPFEMRAGHIVNEAGETEAAFYCEFSPPDPRLVSRWPRQTPPQEIELPPPAEGEPAAPDSAPQKKPLGRPPLVPVIVKVLRPYRQKVGRAAFSKISVKTLHVPGRATAYGEAKKILLAEADFAPE